MSLDKQRILNELGSVMNQLQSADCGCMGKLFSNPGQGGMGHPLPTCGGCRRGCCRGHGASCAGDMCGMGMGSGMPGMGGSMSATGGGSMPGMGGSMPGMGGGMPGMGRGMPGMGGGMPGMGGGMPGMGGGMPGMGEGMPGMGGGMPGMGGGMNGMGSGIAGMDSGMSGMDGGMPGMSGAHNGLGGGMMNSAGGMGGRGNGMPCMGSCNPKKVYADTYNYLNQNLMQPVVQDVYNELSSISPSNTVGNNPLANTMGLSPGNATMQGNAPIPMQGNAMGDSSAMQNMSGMSPGNPNQSMGGAMGAGMGAQIMNMMMSGGKGKPTGVSNDGQMIIDAPQSPHGQVGVAPMNPMGQTNTSMGQGYMNPPTQYVTQDNVYGSGQENQTTNSIPQPGNPMTAGMVQGQPAAGGNMGQQQMTGNMAQGNVVQNISAPNQGGAGFMNQTPNMGNNSRYGRHVNGMKKFNEMFPGLMNGELGFDPMAIAIQMNPANQKRTAMDTMAKLMNGDTSSKMEPSVTGTNVAAAQFAQLNQQQALQQPQQGLVQNQVPANQITNQQMISQSNLVPVNQLSNQQMGNAGAVPQQNQQQVYQAVTGNQEYQQGQQQQMVNPNTRAVVNTPGTAYQSNEGDPNAQQQSAPSNEATDPAQQQQQMYKEPIFPAFTRNQVLGIVPPQPQKQMIYNTLGQPVELLPGNMYHTPEPPLPQTLSPNPQNIMKFKSPGGKLGVKSTVSKTSLMGLRPTGRVPSKSQLQQIYQQYKGSQSFTNQNIIRAPGQGGSSSAGKLNTANNNVNQPPQIPIEKVGGDTAANNNQIINKVEQVMGQIGDVPAAQKGDVDKAPPARNARLRNGLQDMVYTSPPSNAAWSFHGEYNPSMRYRSIYR